MASFEGLGQRTEGCGFDLFLEYDRVLRPGAYFAVVDSQLPNVDLSSLRWSNIVCEGVSFTRLYRKAWQADPAK